MDVSTNNWENNVDVILLKEINKARIHGYIHILVIIYYNPKLNALITQTELHPQQDLLNMLSIYTL